MASIVQDACLDSGLTYIQTNANKLYLVNADPTTYTQASSTFALGNATITAGAPAAGAPNGRKTTISAIAAGSVTVTGTATGWAVVVTGSSGLLVNGQLSASQAVTNGNTFSLPAFDIRYPNQ